MKIKNIFLTGPLHIGKSTIIDRVIPYLSDWNIGGFRIVTLHESQRRAGFALKSFDGRQECFAHVDWKTADRFDVYHYDAAIFERFGVAILQEALQNSDLIIMDEIGVMERQAQKFQETVIRCLDASAFVMGAFQQRANWFVNFIQSRKDTKIFIIDNGNRNEIPNQIISLLQKQFMQIKFST